MILDPGRPIAGLNDSKKLSARKREALAEQIRGTALAWGVAEATAAEIDQINILQASLLAMQRAVAALTGAQGRVSPSCVLVDGTHCPSLSCPVEAILGGDGKVASIAAASILAKTFRDAGMLVLHASHPHGFDRHKGYPTAMHLQALREYGASVQHRRSYAPVARLGQP